ncbi:hypothetical protein [Falsiroseomonas sp. HW251]|uniref:hypothetical protein n=1 Tax=Falsiroseomonas sp. HW251 TaxID=3390998 RepID=UPI003D318EAF
MRCLLVLLLFAAPALAQVQETEVVGSDPMACTDRRAGAVACMAGRLCACGYQRGGIVSGRPDGWRWDCGVLRPACGDPVPATAPSQPMPMPQLFMNLPTPQYPQPPYTPWQR